MAPGTNMTTPRRRRFPARTIFPTAWSGRISTARPTTATKRTSTNGSPIGRSSGLPGARNPDRLCAGSVLVLAWGAGTRVEAQERDGNVQEFGSGHGSGRVPRHACGGGTEPSERAERDAGRDGGDPCGGCRDRRQQDAFDPLQRRRRLYHRDRAKRDVQRPAFLAAL